MGIGIDGQTGKVVIDIYPMNNCKRETEIKEKERERDITHCKFLSRTYWSHVYNRESYGQVMHTG